MPNQTLLPDLTSVRHIREMRLSIYRHMLATRGWKYKAFLRYLRFFKWAAFAPVRGAFLESYYTLMRYLDDVVDGDAPLPEGYLDESEYLLEKIRFSEDPGPPGGKRIISPIKIGKRGLTFHEKVPWRRPRTSSVV